MSIDNETSTQPDIPEKSWTNPFHPGTPLYERFEKLVSQNRDIVIIIDDWNAGRGTGKTIGALQLAEGMDQNGGLTEEKTTLRPEELREAYSTQPKRSGLVLDEGELGASNRRAMTKVNQALREIMSMGRVEEKYVVVTTPLRGFIDKDIQKLADVWISMTARGQGLVHFYEWEPYSEQLMTPHQQSIEFEDIERGTRLRKIYNRLTRQKRKHIRGEEGNGFIPLSEHEERLEKQEKQVTKDTRNEIIGSLLTDTRIQEQGISQERVAKAVGVSQSTVSNIVREYDG